jgi:D-glycero-D-manno-heptose 1,7-bisphosphate phosphatase
LFLDRDGVILTYVPYLHRPEDVSLAAGAAETIARANRLDIPVVLVTNQAGIGRGLYGWQDFYRTHQAMAKLLSHREAHLDAVLACPYHPEAVGIYAHPDHPARKPRAGMLLKAAEILPIDLQRSWIVGDRWTDLQAGHAAGLAGGTLLLGEPAGENDNAPAAMRGFRILTAASLGEAASAIPLFAAGASH